MVYNDPMAVHVLLPALAALLLTGCGGLTGLAGDGGRDPADALPELDAAPEDAPEGADVPDGGEDPMQPITLEEYCERRISFQCAYFVSCCTPDEFDEIGVSCSSDYVQRQIAYCMSLFAPPQEAGTLAYDGGAAAACVLALEDMAAGCPNFTLYFHRFKELHLEFCLDVFTGFVPDGGTCRIDQECAEGYCLIPEDGDEGACRNYSGTGEFCSENPSCGPEAACVSGRCARLGLEGDPCDATSDLSANDCAPRLWCDGGACAPLLVTGRECAGPVSCEGACSEGLEPPLCIDFCNGL